MVINSIKLNISNFGSEIGCIVILNYFFRDADKRIEKSLEVLSEALEIHKGYSKLWVYYFDLLERKTNDRVLLSKLLAKAVDFAPSFDIHWKVGIFALLFKFLQPFGIQRL